MGQAFGLYGNGHDVSKYGDRDEHDQLDQTDYGYG